MPAPNNLPLLSNSLTAPEAWINQFVSLSSFLSVSPLSELIFTTPSTIVPGKIYLISSPQTGTSPGTSGDAIVYLTTSASSAIPLVVPNKTVIGGYTKFGANWVRNQFVNGGLVVITTGATLNLPNDFEGICDVVVKVTGANIIEATGRAPGGLMGAFLPVGCYQVYQDSSQAII